MSELTPAALAWLAAHHGVITTEQLRKHSCRPQDPDSAARARRAPRRAQGRLRGVVDGCDARAAVRSTLCGTPRRVRHRVRPRERSSACDACPRTPRCTSRSGTERECPPDARSPLPPDDRASADRSSLAGRRHRVGLVGPPRVRPRGRSAVARPPLRSAATAARAEGHHARARCDRATARTSGAARERAVPTQPRAPRWRGAQRVASRGRARRGAARQRDPDRDPNQARAGIERTDRPRRPRRSIRSLGYRARHPPGASDVRGPGERRSPRRATCTSRSGRSSR